MKYKKPDAIGSYTHCYDWNSYGNVRWATPAKKHAVYSNQSILVKGESEWRSVITL